MGAKERISLGEYVCQCENLRMGAKGGISVRALVGELWVSRGESLSSF